MMLKKNERILFVACDLVLRDRLFHALTFEGMWCDAVGDVAVAAERCATEPFDLVAVDLTPSPAEGSRLCRDLRQHVVSRSVLILAFVASGEEADAVEALMHGADGYLVKPFRTREFLACVMAMLRRMRELAPRQFLTVPPIGSVDTVVRLGDLDMDVEQQRVRREGCDVPLTEQQFRLLYLFMTNPGRVFSRQALIDRLWMGNRHVTARAVDAVIRRLRRQLRGSGDRVPHVRTVRGSGYKLVAPDEELAPVSARMRRD